MSADALRPMGLTSTCRGHYSKRGNLVALASQNLELEAIEREALARLWDCARFVNHKPRNCGGLLVGQLPVKLAVEIPDRSAAVNDK